VDKLSGLIKPSRHSLYSFEFNVSFKKDSFEKEGRFNNSFDVQLFVPYLFTLIKPRLE
jgi:hypothetical protein